MIWDGVDVSDIVTVLLVGGGGREERGGGKRGRGVEKTGRGM